VASTSRYLAVLLPGAAPVSLSSSASDSFVLSDAATRTAAGPRTASESLVLADAVTRTTTRARTASESLVLADAVTRGRAGVRGTAETLTLADTITLGGGIARSAADSFVLADTTSRGARTGSRAPAESLVLADTVTRTLHRGSTVTEAFALSDAATRTGARPRTAGESLALSDAFSTTTTDVLRTFSPSRTFTPQMVFGNPTAPVSTSRAVSEALVLSDLGTPSGAHRVRGGADSFSLADAASATGADVLRIFDPSRVFTTRMVFGTPIANPSAVDTFFLSDVAERSGSVRDRTLVEALGLNDVVTRATHQPRVISESLALSDAIVTVFRGRSVTETLRLADLVVRTTSRSRARTDAFTLADSVFWSGGTKLRTLPESLVLLEAETRHLSASRILEDDLLLSDAYSTPPVYSLFKGTVPVSRIYLGTTPVLAIYRGTTRVF
jgi:hypothetical protein